MRDTNSSSTSDDCSRESRLTSATDCTLPAGFFSEDPVLFPAASGVEVLVFSEVGRCGGLAVVWEGCWLGEAGLPLLTASDSCSDIREWMIWATVSRNSLFVLIFHCSSLLTSMNMTSMGLLMSGVLLQMEGGSTPSSAARADVLPLPAIPNSNTLSMARSKWPRCISSWYICLDRYLPA